MESIKVFVITVKMINKKLGRTKMKICITSQGDTLQSQVDPRFGRCAYFIIHDTDTRKIEVIKNNNVQNMGGVGVQSGRLVVDKGVNILLTGNVGPNAYQTLQTGEVEVITGVSGTVEEVLDKYQKGELKAAEESNVESHFGMKGSK